MNWIELSAVEQLQALAEESKDASVLIFKHSYRCSASSMALGRIERNWDEREMKNVRPYFLDLITHRKISNAVAEVFGVEHESPQVILIKDGVTKGAWSHFDISYQTIRSSLQ